MSDKLSSEIVERALEAYLLDLQTNPLNTDAMRNSPTWPRISRGMQLSAMREALLAASPAPAIPAVDREAIIEQCAALADSMATQGYPANVIGRDIRALKAAPAISESEDAERLDFMATWGASVVWSRDRDVCWIVRHEDDDGELVSKKLSAAFDTPREAIDAARKEKQS